MSELQETIQTGREIFAAAKPEAVFGEPFVAGDYTVITASEVFAAGGFGGGEGSDGEEQGSGVGGGGTSSGRPVGAVIIGPNGVRYEPIIDVTKLAIAAVSALGALFLAVRRVRAAEAEMQRR